MKETNKLVGSFVLLSADGVKILIPQSNIGQAHYLPVNEQWIKHQSYDGLFSSENMKDTLFVALSNQLKPLKKSSQDRFIALPLHTKNNPLTTKILWVWNSAQILLNRRFDLIKLPQFISQSRSPVIGYVEYNNEIVYYCDTDKLITYALNNSNYQN